MLSFLNKQSDQDDVEVLLPKNTLNKRIFALDEDEIKEMFKINLKITTIKDETEQMRKEKEELIKRHEESKTKFQNIVPMANQYKIHLSNIRNQILEVDNILSTIQTMNQKVSNKLNKLNIVHNKLETYCDIQEETYQQNIINQDSYKIAQSDAEIEALQVKIQITQMRDDIFKLENEININREKNQQLLEVYNHIKPILDNLNNEINMTKTTIEKKSKDTKEEEDTTFHDQESLNILNKKIMELSQKKSVLLNTIQEVKNGIEEVKKENRDLLEHKYSTNKNDNRSKLLMEQKEKFQQELNEKKEEVDELTQEIYDTRNRIKTITNSLSSDEVSNKEHSSFINTISHQIEEQEMIKQNLSELNQKLKNKLKNIQFNIQYLQQQRNKCNDEINQMKKLHLKQQIDNIVKKNSLKQQLNEEIRKEENLQREIKLLMI